MHFRSIDLRNVYAITEANRLHSLLYHLVSNEKRIHIATLNSLKYTPDDSYEMVLKDVAEPVMVVIIDDPNRLLGRLEKLLKSITTKPTSLEDIENLSDLYQDLKKCILNQ